jgi:hypothetical protein
MALAAPWLLVSTGALAQAQPAAAANATAAGAAQAKCDPRDAKDLRATLQQQRLKCDEATDASPPGRQLSVAEKAQLREQLRQQR